MRIKVFFCILADKPKSKMKIFFQQCTISLNESGIVRKIIELKKVHSKSTTKDEISTSFTCFSFYYV